MSDELSPNPGETPENPSDSSSGAGSVPGTAGPATGSDPGDAANPDSGGQSSGAMPETPLPTDFRVPRPGEVVVFGYTTSDGTAWQVPALVVDTTTHVAPDTPEVDAADRLTRLDLKYIPAKYRYPDAGAQSTMHGFRLLDAKGVRYMAYSDPGENCWMLPELLEDLHMPEAPVGKFTPQEEGDATTPTS